MARLTGCIALLIGLIGAMPGARAQDLAYTARHQAWSVYCDPCASPEESVCSLTSGNLTVVPLFPASVLYAIDLPPGSGGALTFLVDSLAPVTVQRPDLVFEAMNNEFRVSEQVSGQLISLFRQGYALRVVYAGAGGRTAREEVSLAGFTAARDDLFAIHAQMEEDQVFLACNAGSSGIAPSVPGPLPAGTPLPAAPGVTPGAVGELSGASLEAHLVGNSILATDAFGRPVCRHYAPGGTLAVDLGTGAPIAGSWQVQGSSVCHAVQGQVACERLSFPSPGTVFLTASVGGFTSTGQIWPGNRCGVAQVPVPAAPTLPAVTDLSGSWRIIVSASGRHLHANEPGDRLVSTRVQPFDPLTVFVLERQADNSYRIRVAATGAYLHEDGNGDRLVSTRYQPNDGFTRFFFQAQPDGSYRVRGLADGRFWRVGADGLLSTRDQVFDGFATFRLQPPG